MVCGSIATARGQVEAAHLLKLLTLEQRITLLGEYLKAKTRQQLTVSAYSGSLSARAGQYSVYLTAAGSVSVSSSRYSTSETEREMVRDEVVQLISQAARGQFQQLVHSYCTAAFGITDEQWQGGAHSLMLATEPAVQVVTMPNATIGFFIREGSYAEGFAQIKDLFTALNAAGIPIVPTNAAGEVIELAAAVENHIQDDIHDVVHAVQHQRGELHSHFSQ